MGFDDCYQLGHIVRTHGLKGEVVLFLDVDDPQEYQEMESVLIAINGKLIPFFISNLQLQGDRAIASIEDVNSIDEAKPLVGCELYLPLDNLPELEKGQYYYHQLVGLQLYDGSKLIGSVTEVYEGPTQILLSVDHKGTEVLVPHEDEIILDVDLENKKIMAVLPDGLLDIYLNPDKP